MLPSSGISETPLERFRMSTPRRILIFRIGSLGDTCIAMPALHLVRQRFPSTEIAVLTNFSIDGGVKAASLQSVLGESGLVDLYFDFNAGSLSDAMKLRREIRAWKPDLLVYMMPVRSFAQRARDWIFFKLAGVRDSVGLSLFGYQHLKGARDDYWESEANRLVRAIAALGHISLQDHRSWDLELKEAEKQTPRTLLNAWIGNTSYIVVSVGTKVDVKDWGADRWISWAEQVSLRYPKLGLVLIGVNADEERSETMRLHWGGPSLNLCGKLTPRESAYVLENAMLFVGHDSGPMHLAAAVQTPCVAIFSSRSLPGIWFPFGEQHRVFYNRTDCAGCGLDVCTVRAKECILGISVDAVLDGTYQILQELAVPAESAV